MPSHLSLPEPSPMSGVAAQPAVASPPFAAVMVAAALGVALLFVSGFAAPALVHNAAHDWRHAHNFPCH